MGGSFDTWPLIRLDALDRAEEETGANASEFYALAARAGDRAYYDVLNRHPYLFSINQRPLMLQVFGPLTPAVTITWATGSYQATLSSVVAQNLTGWKVQPSGQNFGYRVFRHVPGSASITLETLLQGGASLPAGTACVIYKDEYTLAALQDTPAALTAALGAAGVLTGAYSYKYTWGNENGETLASGPSNVINPAAQQGSLTGVLVGPPGTLFRNIYRTLAGGVLYYLVGTISENVTTTFADNVADATIQVNQQDPIENTTGAVRHITAIYPKGQTVREVEGPIELSQLLERYPDPPTPTWPPFAYSRQTDRLLRFSHYPSQNGILEIQHSFIPKDLSQTVGPDEIVVPRNFRWVLSDGTLFHLLDMKHDDRAANWKKIFEAGIADIKSDDDTKKLGLEGTRNRTRVEPAY